MLHNDRREFQRLKLAKPILASMGTANALILDLGIGGAFLEHYGTVEPGAHFQLSFRWQGADVAFDCEVARSTVIRDLAGDGKSTVSHTGVRFSQAIGESSLLLQDLIATFVGKILAAQKANASGQKDQSPGATILARLGEARRMRTRGFVTYHLKADKWWRAPSESAVQPNDGFTVGAHEEEEEIDTLCRAYEIADEEGRNLIRLVAELSLLRER